MPHTLPGNLCLDAVAAGVTNRLATILIPQRAYKLCDSNCIGVVTDQPQDKHSILSQVLVHEAGDRLLVCVPLQLLHELQMLLNVAVAVIPEDRSQHPGEEGEAGDDGYQHHPEPQEQIDLLVE